MTISQLKNHLEAMLHGGSVNKVKNFYELCWRAAGNLLLQIDPAETRRITNLTNAIHDDYYNYSLPSDVKGNKIIDIRPQVSRQTSEQFRQKFGEEFDLRKAVEDDIFATKHDDGSKSIRISKDISPGPTTVNSCNSLTTNGTWAADGTYASNLTLDTLYYVSGSASLNFDLASDGSTGYIENTTMTAVDLTDHDEVGWFFAHVYFPDASIITNVILDWGNDLTTNYWSRTATTQYDGTSFRDGWNVIGFNWHGATETGTVAPATIDSLKVTITYDGTAETDIRVDNITCSVGEIMEIEYYSKYLFRDSDGTWLELPSDDTDIINLDTDSNDIFIYECLMEIAQQTQGEDMRADFEFARWKLYGDAKNMGLYHLYKTQWPPEAIKASDIYYRL